MSAEYPLNSQDWYRVRRGEDQIAWGRRWRAETLPGIVFSDRARGEFEFVEPEERMVLRQALRDMTSAADEPKGRAVAHGQGRRILFVGDLRVIFRVVDGDIWISTIRGGPVLDPEHAGPPPASGVRWLPE